jgi:hypothetical protein
LLGFVRLEGVEFVQFYHGFLVIEFALLEELLLLYDDLVELVEDGLR